MRRPALRPSLIHGFLQAVGATLIAVGVGVLVGVGAGLVAAGVGVLVLSVADEVQR